MRKAIEEDTYVKDIDVEEEERRVYENKNKENYALCIDSLVKIYPPSLLGGVAKHAVRGLSLGCEPGERFGFLGVNGAGKSSTLNVLTGDIASTGGEVYIGGHSLTDPTTRQAIGMYMCIYVYIHVYIYTCTNIRVSI
jgi:ATP-binding cassette subfamily A (ABC1) protein 2